eukprot:469407_1
MVFFIIFFFFSFKIKSNCPTMQSSDTYSSIRLQHKHRSYLESKVCKFKTNANITYRKFSLIKSQLITHDFLTSLFAATSTVYSIGILEAMLLSKRPYNLRFLTRYSREQILPSIIWTTKPAEQIVNVLRLNKTLILYDFINQQTNQSAKWLLRIQSLQTLRSIIFGFVGIAQILRLAEIITNVNNDYKQNVLNGKEQLNVENISERIIRFAGLESDVTNYSMTWLKHHIIPIIVNPKYGKTKQMIIKHTNNGEIPSFWTIENHNYGKMEQWNGFKIDSKWLIKTSNNKNILIVEADSSVCEQSLSLNEQSINDLPLHDISQAFASIERIALEQNIIQNCDQIVSVLLADSNSKLCSGSGHKYTLKQRINKFNDIDILIDSRRPLIKAIVEWLENTNINNKEKIVLFDTANINYFNNIRAELNRYGWKIEDYMLYEDDNELIYPLLIYQNSTFGSVDTVRSHCKSKHSDVLNNCCVLLDDHIGVEALNQLKLQQKNNCKTIENVTSICSAIIYDDLFENVRMRLKHGETEQQIQSWLQTYLTY